MKENDSALIKTEELYARYGSYEDFLQRISSFQKRKFKFGVKTLTPSDSVKVKVNEDGTFNRNFVGNTVVFDLDDSQKSFIYNRYIKPFYLTFPHCFANSFSEKTVHVTLHDLYAWDDSARGASKYAEMKIVEEELYNSEKRKSIEVDTITMRTTCVFNMVNTSMVLGLKPKTEEDYIKLMRLYSVVDEFKTLPYPLTPHITLAYFSRQGLSEEDIQKMEPLIDAMNMAVFEVTLSTDKLFHQKFSGMDDFVNTLSFVEPK